MRLLAALLPLAALAAPALAQQDPGFALIEQMRAQCEAWGDTLYGPDEAYVSIMQAGDGTRIDMFSQADYGCLQDPAVFRTAAGGVIVLRVATLEGNTYRVTDARSWQVVLFGGEDVMMLLRHGSACGAPGYMVCVEAITWHDGRFLSVAPAE